MNLQDELNVVERVWVLKYKNENAYIPSQFQQPSWSRTESTVSLSKAEKFANLNSAIERYNKLTSGLLQIVEIEINQFSKEISEEKIKELNTQRKIEDLKNRKEKILADLEKINKELECL